MKSVNIYLVYSEVAKPDPDTPQLNSRTIQCDGIKELVYELRECERDGRKNVIISTIQNGKPQ